MTKSVKYRLKFKAKIVKDERTFTLVRPTGMSLEEFDKITEEFVEYLENG